MKFGYDALGRRIWKNYKQTTTNWVWDGNVPLHEWKGFVSKDALTENLITWIFEEDSFSPIAKLRGEKKYSILADHLGTPIEAYADDGNLVWERSLNANGKVIKETGIQNFCPFLYQGQSFDNEIELAYNRFRYYDVEDGRYISQDPIGLLSEEYNFYNYVFDTNNELDLYGLARSKYATRSKASLKAMRKAFNKRGRKKFLKRLGKDVDQLKERGFTDDQIKQIQNGEVPTGYEVHHKKPLFRGGDNSFKNLDLMEKSVHKAKFKELHYYDGDVSPYYL